VKRKAREKESEYHCKTWGVSDSKNGKKGPHSGTVVVTAKNPIAEKRMFIKERIGEERQKKGGDENLKESQSSSSSG